ncbi:MAG: ATP synthase F1 subunit delta [Acidobacteria bacterium]|nr:ATP synthase F1 subunit delta [Acidobacteriota bacterium]
MNTRASAARFARALLDVVIQEGDPEQVERQLQAFADLYRRHPDLHKALTSPIVPPSGKRGIVERLTAHLEMAPVAARLLLLLAERDRLALVPDVVAVYSERLLEHRHVVRAELTTAVPLPADRAARLEQRLSEVTGRRVTMTTRVDPALIGGAVARVGSTVYDGSIATQLGKIRERLKA